MGNGAFVQPGTTVRGFDLLWIRQTARVKFLLASMNGLVDVSRHTPLLNQPARAYD